MTHRRRSFVSLAIAVAIVWAWSPDAFAQGAALSPRAGSAAPGWSHGRTPDGQPDLALRHGREVVTYEVRAFPGPAVRRLAIGHGPAGSAGAPEALRPTVGALPGDAPRPGPQAVWTPMPLARTPKAANTASQALERLAGATGAEQGPAQGFEGAESGLLQPDRLEPRSLEVSPGVGVAGPQPEGLLEDRQSGGRLGGHGLPAQRVEPAAVHLVEVDLERVAERVGHQSRSAGRGALEVGTEPGDERVQSRPRLGRCGLATPDLVDEPIGRHRAPGTEEQRGQQRPLTRSRQDCAGPVGVDGRHGAEHTEAFLRGGLRSGHRGALGVGPGRHILSVPSAAATHGGISAGGTTAGRQSHDSPVEDAGNDPHRDDHEEMR